MTVALVLLAWILVGLIRNHISAPYNHIAILLVFLCCGLALFRDRERFRVRPQGIFGWKICVGYLSLLVFAHVAFNKLPELFKTLGLLIRPDWLPTLLTLSVLVPIYEEAFFRGALLTRMKSRFCNKGMLVYINSLIFWVFHAPFDREVWSSALSQFALPLGPGPFLLGLVCATIAVKDNSIFWAIVFHALANALGPVWANIISNPTIFGLFYSQ